MPARLNMALDRLGCDVPGVAAVYLFGSHAAGGARPESAVDLAVLADRPLGAVERFTVQERVAAVLGCDVDLVDLRTASAVMQARTVAAGRVVLDPGR